MAAADEDYSLDSILYAIPYSRVQLRPWVRDAQGKLVMSTNEDDWVEGGDFEEFKLGFSKSTKARYARNRKVRTKVKEVTDQQDWAASFTAMQHSDFIRAMALMSDLTGRTTGLPGEIDIGTVAQHNLEIKVEVVGEDAPQGTLHLYLWQGAAEGDQAYIADDFTGAAFSGACVYVPGKGIGKWIPKAVAPVDPEV